MASRPRKASSTRKSIQETLAKTQIALDLLGEIEKSSKKKRTKVVAPETIKPRTV